MVAGGFGFGVVFGPVGKAALIVLELDAAMVLMDEELEHGLSEELSGDLFGEIQFYECEYLMELVFGLALDDAGNDF